MTAPTSAAERFVENATSAILAINASSLAHTRANLPGPHSEQYAAIANRIDVSLAQHLAACAAIIEDPGLSYRESWEAYEAMEGRFGRNEPRLFLFKPTGHERQLLEVASLIVAGGPVALSES